MEVYNSKRVVLQLQGVRSNIYEVADGLNVVPLNSKYFRKGKEKKNNPFDGCSERGIHLVRLEVCYDRHVKRANSALRYQKALVDELNLKLLHSWKGLSVKHLEFLHLHLISDKKIIYIAVATQ